MVQPISYKVKHTPNVWLRQSTPRYKTKREGSIHAHKGLHLHTNVHGSIIHKSPKLETQTTIKSVDKLWYIQRVE